MTVLVVQFSVFWGSLLVVTFGLCSALTDKESLTKLVGVDVGWRVDYGNVKVWGGGRRIMSMSFLAKNCDLTSTLCL